MIKGRKKKPKSFASGKSQNRKLKAQQKWPKPDQEAQILIFNLIVSQPPPPVKTQINEVTMGSKEGNEN